MRWSVSVLRCVTQRVRFGILLGMENTKPTRCSEDGCAGRPYAKGLCYRHYYSQPKGSCTVVGCSHQVTRYPVAGLCNAHYHRVKRDGEVRADVPLRPPAGSQGTTCSVEGCNEPHAAKGLCLKHRHVTRHYGLTVEQFLALGDHCTICGIGAPTKLVVDHNHSTGAVRGLLCQACNTFVGYVECHPERLRKVVRYLKTQ